MKPILAIIALLCAGCSPMVMTHGVPNLKIVDASTGIYRGGQPTAEGWMYLKTLGITNDLKLNMGTDATIIPQTDVGISFARQIFGPTTDQVDAAYASIAPHTFIHCTHGQDRTGLLVAIWRVRNDGWTKSRARAEMLSNNFHRSLVGLDWFWREKTQTKTNHEK